MTGHPFIAVVPPSPVAGDPLVIRGGLGDDDIRLRGGRSLRDYDHAILRLGGIARNHNLRGLLGHNRGGIGGRRRWSGNDVGFRFRSAARQKCEPARDQRYLGEPADRMADLGIQMFHVPYDRE